MFPAAHHIIGEYHIPHADVSLPYTMRYATEIASADRHQSLHSAGESRNAKRAGMICNLSIPPTFIEDAMKCQEQEQHSHAFTISPRFRLYFTTLGVGWTPGAERAPPFRHAPYHLNAKIARPRMPFLGQDDEPFHGPARHFSSLISSIS